MKFISKTLSVFILSSALLVNAQNECDELKNDLGDKVEIIECKNDDEGKISLLKINDFGMEEEDFKKVQSYKTISDFSYTLSNGKVNEKSGYPTSIDYLTNLKNLENLEKLYIGYNTYTMNCDPNYSSYPECYTYFSAPIGKNTFKDLKNLRELSLYRIDLHQDNINEISTLNNLKSLNTESSIFKKISDSKALNNLDNMNSFTYKASVVGESITILPMELLNNIKSLKKLNIQLYSNFHGAASFLHDELNLEFTEKSNIENLYLHGIRIKDNTVDEILKLNNIKELKFDTCIFDLNDEEYTKLENLGNRCPIKITYNYCDYQEPLENVNNKNCESTATEKISTTTKKSTIATTKATTKESTTSTTNETTTKKSTATGTTKKTSTTKKPTTKTTKKTTIAKKSSTTKTTTKKSSTIKTTKKTSTTKKSNTTKTNKKTTTNKKSTTTKTTKKTSTTKKSNTTKTNKKTTTNKKSTTTKTTKKTSTTKKSNTTKTPKKTTTNKKSTNTKTTKKTSTTKKSTNAKTTKKTTTNKKSTTTKTTKKTTTNKKSTTTKTTKKTTTNKKSTTTKTTKKTTTKKSTTKTTKTIPISTSRHGECGPRFGSCKEGYCCSKHGYCGKTDKYCGKGCQSEYGFCN